MNSSIIQYHPNDSDIDSDNDNDSDCESDDDVGSANIYQPCTWENVLKL